MPTETVMCTVAIKMVTGHNRTAGLLKQITKQPAIEVLLNLLNSRVPINRLKSRQLTIINRLRNLLQTSSLRGPIPVHSLHRDRIRNQLHPIVSCSAITKTEAVGLRIITTTEGVAVRLNTGRALLERPLMVAQGGEGKI